MKYPTPVGLVDLRNHPIDASRIRAFLRAAHSFQEKKVAIAAHQLDQISGLELKKENCLVVVPDFLQYGRLLSTGKFKDFLALAPARHRIGAITRAGFSALSTPLASARQNFWSVARALVTFDLALARSHAPGALVLHPYLADLAFALGRKDFFEFWRDTTARTSMGVWTLQPALALSLLETWDIPTDWLVSASLEGQINAWTAIETARQSPFYKKTQWVEAVPQT